MSIAPAEVSLGRTPRKRQAILAAATALFLQNGYRGTSMDEIASRAEVSKQTVYKQFTDKEHLFREILGGMTSNAERVVDVIASAFGPEPARTPTELEHRLRRVALVYLDGVLRPQVLSLRRLIIAEAEQFPELAAAYYEQAPSRGIQAVARCLEPYVDSGLIEAEDLRLAACHFAYLALAPTQDRAQFIPTELPAAAERERLAAAAAHAFLRAYGAGAGGFER